MSNVESWGQNGLQLEQMSNIYVKFKKKDFYLKNLFNDNKIVL